MTERGESTEERSHGFARTATEAFADTAGYLRTLPAAAWNGPTGCEKWDVRKLAGHIVGEAVWFVNVVRGVTHDEPPLPDAIYTALNSAPTEEIADRLQTAGDQISETIAEASPDDLQQAVDLGWTQMPLWRATFVSAMEAVLHNWDARVGRDVGATIPTPWALQIASLLPEAAPHLVNRAGAEEAVGRYLLQVGDGVGPITVQVADGAVTVERGAAGQPDVTINLSADQFDRLVAGRLDLGPAVEQGTVRAEGDRARAAGLNRVFHGIANS